MLKRKMGKRIRKSKLKRSVEKRKGRKKKKVTKKKSKLSHRFCCSSEKKVLVKTRDEG